MKTARVRAAILSSLLAALVMPPVAEAAPRFLAQQGRLLDVSGRPISGMIKMRFALYAQPTEGEPFWIETQEVPVEDGYFHVVLGSKTALEPALFDGLPVHLGISVQEDPEMRPREEIVSVPYALFAGDVRGHINPSGVSINGTQVIDHEGNWVGPGSGLMGPSGESVAATPLPAGHATCAHGGVQFSVGGQTTYACNGTPGTAGPAGAAGPQGPAGPQGVAGPAGPAGPMGPAGPQGAAGPQGSAGLTGATGATGPQGLQGPQGPPGPQGATGPSGTAGQAVYAAWGNATMNITPTSATNPPFQQIPGLSTTVTVPANSAVLVSTYGGIQTQGTLERDYSAVDIALHVNGAVPPQGAWQRVTAANTTGLTRTLAYWHITTVVSLPAGTHTFTVRARPSSGGVAASVGGDNTTVTQPELNVTVLRL